MSSTHSEYFLRNSRGMLAVSTEEDSSRCRMELKQVEQEGRDEGNADRREQAVRRTAREVWER
jgi:hypothetical protein